MTIVPSTPMASRPPYPGTAVSVPVLPGLCPQKVMSRTGGDERRILPGLSQALPGYPGNDERDPIRPLTLRLKETKPLPVHRQFDHENKS